MRLVGICTVLLAAALELPATWKNWRFSAPLELGATDRPRLVSVVVPPQVSARALPGLDDLRVIDSQGLEHPYVLYARLEKQTREWRTARLLEISFLPGRATQAVVDTGTDGQIHNALEMKTGEKDYFVWVEIAVSNDSRNWRVLRERAPIYRFAHEGLDGNQVIRYSPSNSRYLRLRLLEGNRKFPLEGCRIAHEVVEEAERMVLDVPLTPDPATPGQQSWWVADLGAARQPVSEVRFEVAQPEFHRAIRVNTSADGKNWRAAGSGAIYRSKSRRESATSLLDTGQERLRIAFPETRARYWRVEVLNRSDAPLAGVRIALYGTPRRVVFRQEPGQGYRLIYGNSRAHAPQYEMARLTDPKVLQVAAPGNLGAEETNRGYADPAPWSERHPYILWMALGVAVALLGLLALRTLRGADAETQP